MPKRYFLCSSSSAANILCLTWRTPRPLGSGGNKKGLWSLFNSFLPRFHWHWTYRIPSICLASFLQETEGFSQPQYYVLEVNCLFYLTWLPPSCPAGVCICQPAPSPQVPLALRAEESIPLEHSSRGTLSAHLGWLSVLLWKLWRRQWVPVQQWRWQSSLWGRCVRTRVSHSHHLHGCAGQPMAHPSSPTY